MIGKRIIPKHAEVLRQLRSEAGYNNPSPADITRGINEFWEAFIDQTEKHLGRPDVPQPVFDAASALFETACDHANAFLAQERQDFAAKKDRLESELAASENEFSMREKGLAQRLQAMESELIHVKVQRDAALTEAAENKVHMQQNFDEERQRNQRELDRLEKLLEKAIAQYAMKPG
jgi:hypothetical protein